LADFIKRVIIDKRAYVTYDRQSISDGRMEQWNNGMLNLRGNDQSKIDLQQGT
jgi:hypothetical protein